MKLINDKKLTPFDLQVLNLSELAPDEWKLDDDRMYHDQLGAYGPSLCGFGLQLENLRGTANYRELSWRGQIRLKQRHRAITRTAVNVSATTRTTVSASNHAQDALKFNLGSAQKTGGLKDMTATGMLQAQRAQMDLLYRQQLLAQQHVLSTPAPPPAVEMLFGHRVEELMQQGLTAGEIAELKKALHTDVGDAAGLIAKLTDL